MELWHGVNCSAFYIGKDPQPQNISCSSANLKKRTTIYNSLELADHTGQFYELVASVVHDLCVKAFQGSVHKSELPGTGIAYDWPIHNHSMCFGSNAGLVILFEFESAQIQTQHAGCRFPRHMLCQAQNPLSSLWLFVFFQKLLKHWSMS